MPKDVAPAILRDILITWFFATVNPKQFQNIASGTDPKISAANLLNKLQQAGSIKIDDSQKNQFCEDMCAAIQLKQNRDAFTAIQSILTSLRPFSSSWTGGGPVHPLEVELSNAFIPLSGGSAVTRGLTEAISRVQPKPRYKKSGSKKTDSRRTRK